MPGLRGFAMSDIPQVEDQFLEEAPDLRLVRYVPTPSRRFPILCAEDFDFDDLRRALNASGFVLTAHADGWYLDKVHALALVQKSTNDADAPAAPMWPHDCPEDGPIDVAVGCACNWCGRNQPTKETS